MGHWFTKTFAVISEPSFCLTGFLSSVVVPKNISMCDNLGTNLEDIIGPENRNHCLHYSYMLQTTECLFIIKFEVYILLTR